MTRDAVRRTYQRFLERLTDEMLDVVAEEFGGGLLGGVARTGAKTVTKRIQGEMSQQGRVVIEYAAAIAAGNDDVEPFRREFLDTNPVYQRYDGEDEAELVAFLIDHFREVASDLAPLVASDTDDFWEALREEYSREEAEEIVERHFDQAKVFMRYRNDIFSSERVADKTIEVIAEAEYRLRDDLHEELGQTYSEDGT